MVNLGMAADKREIAEPRRLVSLKLLLRLLSGDFIFPRRTKI